MNIKEQFEKNGYELIGTYKRGDSPCLCLCKHCGIKNEICLHSLKRAKIKCKNCNKIEVKNYFESQGCKLISEPDRQKKMDYICSCGTPHSIRWHNFKNGTRCRNCLFEKSSKNNFRKKVVKEKIKNYFNEQGCKLIEEEYKGQYHYLNFVCSCGNLGKVRWKSFLKGSRCSNCAKERIRNRFIPKGSDHCRWNRDRKKILLNKTIRSRIKKSLKRVLKECGKEKIKKTWDHLGYSKEDLVKHITNHPNWKKVKHTDWELDHKFPMKAFFDHNIYDEKIINSLVNLQPLTKKQNRSKNDKYIEEEFLKFIQSSIPPPI